MRHRYAYRPQDPAWAAAWQDLPADVERIIGLVRALGVVLDGPDGAPSIDPALIEMGIPGGDPLVIFGPDLGTEEVAQMPPGEQYLTGGCAAGGGPAGVVLGAVLLRAAQLAPESFVVASDFGWDAEWRTGTDADRTLSARGICTLLFGSDALPLLSREYMAGTDDVAMLFAYSGSLGGQNTLAEELFGD